MATHPCGNGKAPSCCPGAHIWYTQKCFNMACISGKLKKP